MQWVSIILLALQLVSWLTRFLSERKLITEAQVALVVATMTEINNVIQAAQKAREAARARNAAMPPGSSLPDDGFRLD